MRMTAIISTVRAGFSYERARLSTCDWRDLVAGLKPVLEDLADENPDSILIKLERPQ